ncbi:Alpha/Beta hydrolase protein [Calycina marina]|uniref:Alpha/Beta hydrolase protein n=1 Tax=Calycina marina TaxID=1763456 RepID=A0A9P7YXV3_9HELO|nr:Alpha/Beta hydrolase protein [Calycina marina]
MPSDLSSIPLPSGMSESYLPSHDLTYHILTSGKSNYHHGTKTPLLLLLHGFPEIAYSWRKIMPALANQGYYVVAYDQRGYGSTTNWDTRPFSEVDLKTFSMTRVVRDAVILVNALGYESVDCVIGHDFGAVVASMCALMRPDFFKSVVMMSHPFPGSPKLPFDVLNKSIQEEKKVNIAKCLAELDQPRKHYKTYYATADAAKEMDPPDGMHEFLRGYYYLKSADWNGNHPYPLKEKSATELAKLPHYYVMLLDLGMRESVQATMKNEDPSKVSEQSKRWLPDHELAVYVDAFKRNGFQGGLNYYRIGTSPEYLKDVELFAGQKIDVPSLFISGKRDWGTFQDPGAFEGMGDVCTKYKGGYLVGGAGHWVQQEQPETVVELVLKFLKKIKVDYASY